MIYFYDYPCFISMGVAAIALRDCYLPKGKAITDLKNIFWCVLTIKEFYCKVIRRKKLDLRSDIEKML